MVTASCALYTRISRLRDVRWERRIVGCAFVVVGFLIFRNPRGEAFWVLQWLEMADRKVTTSFTEGWTKAIERSFVRAPQLGHLRKLFMHSHALKLSSLSHRNIIMPCCWVRPWYIRPVVRSERSDLKRSGEEERRNLGSKIVHTSRGKWMKVLWPFLSVSVSPPAVSLVTKCKKEGRLRLKVPV